MTHPWLQLHYLMMSACCAVSKTTDTQPHIYLSQANIYSLSVVFSNLSYYLVPPIFLFAFCNEENKPIIWFQRSKFSSLHVLFSLYVLGVFIAKIKVTLELLSNIDVRLENWRKNSGNIFLQLYRVEILLDEMGEI